LTVYYRIFVFVVFVVFRFNLLLKLIGWRYRLQRTRVAGQKQRAFLAARRQKRESKHKKDD
jgi:hypothetical protein